MSPFVKTTSSVPTRVVVVVEHQAHVEVGERRWDDARFGEQLDEPLLALSESIRRRVPGLQVSEQPAHVDRVRSCETRSATPCRKGRCGLPVFFQ